MSSQSTPFQGVAYSTGYISVAGAKSLTPYDNQTVAMQAFEQTPYNPPGTVNAVNNAFQTSPKGQITGYLTV
ncbi:MAG: hypothetical protein HQK81_08275 [Desulfovibrionaceae bacterium]|nr:hypothetical protein [Desulfovibrionaceae bacterium]MBF0514047.1 hypothetical protein [Desulfovibrionaceae bacterium]